MANECDWHKFYFKKWSADEAVKLMTLEQVGVYWLLLVHQMDEGDIPSDERHLAILARNMDLVRFKTEVWPLLAPKFKPVPGREGRLYNEHLARVMAEDKERRGRLSDAGKKRHVPLKSEGELAAEARLDHSNSTTFDFGPVLADYPRRKDKNGWDYGLRLMQDTITEPEEFARLHAAVKAYKRIRTGEDPKFTKRLDTFMKEWTNFVPATFKFTGTQQEASPPPAQPAPEVKVADPPPWEDVDPGVGKTALEAIARHWTDERKAEWLAKNGRVN